MMQGTANRRLANRKRQSNRFILRVVLEPLDRNVDNEQQRTDPRAFVDPFVEMAEGLTVNFSGPGEALGDAGGDLAASGITLVFI